MAINDVMGLTLDISADTDKFVKDLQSAASGMSLDFDPKPMIRRFGQSQKDIQRVLSRTVADAASAGFNSVKIEGLRKKVAGTAEQIEKQLKVVFDKQLEARQKGLTDERKAALRLEEDKLRELRKRLKEEQKANDEIIERRKMANEEFNRLAKRRMDEAAKELAEVGEGVAGGIESAFSKLKSGDFAGLLKGAGQGASGAGEGLLGRADALKAGGKGGVFSKVLSGLGGLLKSIGPAIAAVGALAAGIAALGAIVLSADGAMKGLNKTLLEGGVSAADLADQYNHVGNTLDRIRSGFTEGFAFNRIWGTTAKDHLEILGAYAEAGLTFREMTEGVRGAGEEMERLKEYTAAALTYSKLLGMSTQEISATMASYMEELGLTLQGVQARFSNIVVAAKESGFATKRFFNMVLQATSGMSMYNVRLEEAAGLLIQLGNILGEKMGGDFLQSLTRGFKDESVQDSIKKTMTTGVGYSLKVLREDATKSAEEFSRKLGELGKTNAEAQGQLQGVLKSFGIDPSNPEAMSKKLAGMSSKDRGAMLAQARAVDPGMGRMLAAASRSAVAHKGGLGGAVAGRQEASAAATLLLNLNEIRAINKGKRLDQIEMDDLQTRAAWENITGKSGEEARKLFEVGQEFAGRQTTLRDKQADIRRLNKEGKTEEAKAASEAFNEQFGKKFGVVLDETGQRFKAVFDPAGNLDRVASMYDPSQRTKVGDTFEDLVMSSGDDLIGKGEARVAEDILLAQEVAANTTDMAKILEQGVEYFLEKIYRSVQYIAGFFGQRGLSDLDRETKARMLEDQSERMEKFRSRSRAMSREVARLEAESSRPSTSAARKAEIQKELARKRKVLTKIQGREARETGRYQQIRDANTPEALQAVSGSEAEAETLMSSAHWQSKIEPTIKTRAEARLADFEKVRGKALSGPERARALSASEDAIRKEEIEKLSKFSRDEAKEVLKATKAMEEELQNKKLSKEEQQRKAAADQIVDGIKRNAESDQERKLALALSQSGVAGGADSLLFMARELRQGRMPSGLDPTKKVKGRSIADILMSSGGASAAMGSVLQGGTPAKDYMVHIDSSGRVVSAQKVTAGDTMYAATMDSGAISQAARKAGRGRGGTTIVQHIYAGDEAARRGFRTLANAKLL